MQPSNLGLIGLGVMGQSLARNFASRGFSVSVYNRTTRDMTTFIKSYGTDTLTGHKELKDFIASLERPRKIILMVSAGRAVDAVISSLQPYLDKGDIVIDCGNSHYRESMRRYDELKSTGIEFVGCGVSGGEEGALIGPSMMPGGSKKSWNQIKKYLEPAAAKDFSGNPCVSYMGPTGAGHYVKMVHNGIEYAIMQMLSEAYALLHHVYGMSSDDIAGVFETYNKGKLGSFLMEISIPVLRKKEGKKHLLDIILDKAGSKGTGKWTIKDALDRGVAVPSIAAAMFARSISSQKDTRLALGAIYKRAYARRIPKRQLIKCLEGALYAGVISSFIQGLELIKTASQEERWHIDLGEVIRIWQGGCIIRAKVLKDFYLVTASHREEHLLSSLQFRQKLSPSIRHLRTISTGAASGGLSVPAFSTALSYLDQMTSAQLPANFIQGLRDYFGAHTYERIDQSGSFHTDWEH